MLAGDGATQLRTIAEMAHWRELHLAMLAGSGLIVAGVWVRLVGDRAFVRPALVAALVLLSIGVTINALNIAYMAGAGWQMASQFGAGDGSMVPLFEATHPIGLMAARFGNFIVALGALVLGWAEWHDAEPRRFDAVLAWIAALGGCWRDLLRRVQPYALAAVASSRAGRSSPPSGPSLVGARPGRTMDRSKQSPGAGVRNQGQGTALRRRAYLTTDT